MHRCLTVFKYIRLSNTNDIDRTIYVNAQHIKNQQIKWWTAKQQNAVSLSEMWQREGTWELEQKQAQYLETGKPASVRCSRHCAWCAAVRQETTTADDRHRRPATTASMSYTTTSLSSSPVPWPHAPSTQPCLHHQPN